MKTLTDLVEDAKRRTVLVCLWVLCLAYLMSLTSNSVWVNAPVALLIIAMIRSLSGEIQIRWRPASPPSFGSRSRLYRYRHVTTKDPRLTTSGQNVVETWRSGIDCPEVEAALEEFTKSVVSEWVTDLWFRSLSPDQEVPDELSEMINNVFAELSQRMKRVNLITLLTQDIVDLLASQLELYRRTQARVGADKLGILSSEERDENIKQALAAAGELHPALVSPDSEYKVLHKLMGGLIDLVLRPKDASCKLVRILSRELLACAVMRPVMNLLNPAFINMQIVNAVMQSQNRSPPPPPSDSSKPAAKRTPDRTPIHREPSEVGLEMVAVTQSKGAAEEDQSGTKSSTETSLTRLGGSGDVSAKGSGDGHSEGPVAKKLEISKGHSGNYGVQSAREPKENWAQLLEVVNQRKKQALAPEHLDNLWAKGRNYKKREANKITAKPVETNVTKEQSICHPLSVEPPVPQAKAKLEGNQKKTTELVQLRESSGSNLGFPDPSLEQDDWNASKMLEVDNEPPPLRRSRSIGAELDGWQALAHPGEGIPSLLKASEGPGLGPGFELDLALRKRKGNQLLYNQLQVDVVGAHFEKGGSKTFAVYSIFVTGLNRETWEVQRRFRNFEQLHRSLKDKPYYNLCLPAKRFLSSNLDQSFIQQRCALLDKYLKDLLAIPSIAELHEVWDFLSANSQTYAFGESPSMFKTLTSNVDDAVDDIVRQFRGASEPKTAPLLTSISEVRKQLMMGTSSAPGSAHLSVQTNSSANNRTGVEKKVPPQIWEEEEIESAHDGHPQHLGIGWSPEFDLHHAGPSSGSPFGSERGLVDTQRDVGKQERSLSEGHSPVGSLAGSDLVEDDNLAIPADWGPPKVSVPLLNLVDVIFELQGRGWIRRQVFWMAKQVLQLGMGDAIDDFLLGKIEELRREEVVAGGIRWLHGILWPNGVFLTKQRSRQANSVQEGSFEQRLEAARRAGVVREIILDRAPAALVRMLGSKQYQRCATDLYFFLQSAVCLKQLTYSLLEMLLLAAFPELQDLVLEVRNL